MQEVRLELMREKENKELFIGRDQRIGTFWIFWTNQKELRRTPGFAVRDRSRKVQPRDTGFRKELLDGKSESACGWASPVTPTRPWKHSSGNVSCVSGDRGMCAALHAADSVTD